MQSTSYAPVAVESPVRPSSEERRATLDRSLQLHVAKGLRTIDLDAITSTAFAHGAIRSSRAIDRDAVTNTAFDLDAIRSSRVIDLDAMTSAKLIEFDNVCSAR